jgi:hypothetical protein
MAVNCARRARVFRSGRRPHGLAISRDGKRLFVPSDGVGQILTEWQSGPPKIVELTLPKPLGDGGATAMQAEPISL